MTDSTDSGVEWTVVYHQPGKIKGRGEFLRLLLEDAGVKYRDTDEGCYTTDMFLKSHTDIAEAAVNTFPLLYPPCIRHAKPGEEPILINQVGACLMYMGEQLGYNPVTSTERAKANCILLNCMDYIADGRSSFHPVDNKTSYHSQKVEGDAASLKFTQTRMLKFLHHFEKVVGLAGKHKPVSGGPGVTYADFALFHVLDATIHQFDNEKYEMAWTKANIPHLKEFYEWFKQRPNLKAYLQSDRCARDSMM